MSDDEPETLIECRACGNGDMRAQCPYCEGTGTMSKAQLFLWRANEQRRRSMSSSYALIETLVRDTLGRVVRSRKEGASELVSEADGLLEKWRATESMSTEREGLARELRRLHRQMLDFLEPEE